MQQTLVHYTLHFIAPLLLSYLFFKKNNRVLKAYLLMLGTMLIDIDHLLATPIFDPNRMSIGFHPLHSYYAIIVYIIMLFIPYERLNWYWGLKAIAIGLVFHIFTDFQDYYLWKLF